MRLSMCVCVCVCVCLCVCAYSTQFAYQATEEKPPGFPRNLTEPVI